MEEIKINLAKNLSKLRKEKGLTQLEFAKKLNYSDKSVSKWENGDTMPDIEVLKKIADFFEVSIDDLISNCENIKHMEIKPIQTQTNKVVVTLLSTILVWIVATVSFTLLNIILKINFWMFFIWAIPVSFIVLIVFNAIWGQKKFSVILTSGLMWTLLASIFLQLLSYNIWPIFFIGIPIQIAIILWNKLKIYKNNG